MKSSYFQFVFILLLGKLSIFSGYLGSFFYWDDCFFLLICVYFFYIMDTNFRIYRKYCRILYHRLQFVKFKYRVS